MQQKFELHGQPFIALNSLLKIMRLVETGGEANLCISDGDVKLNGVVETQKRKKIRAGDTVLFEGKSVVVE